MNSLFRWFLLIACVVVTIGTVWARTITITTELTDSTNYSFTDTIDRFVDNRAKDKTTEWLAYEIPQVLKRIDTLQTRGWFDQQMGAFLGYLEYTLTRISTQPSTSSASIAIRQPNSSTTTQSTTLPKTITLPRYVTSEPIRIDEATVVFPFIIDIQIHDEPLRIKSIDLRSTVTPLQELIYDVGIYDTQGRLIATARPRGDKIRFENIEQSLTQWVHSWYLVVLPRGSALDNTSLNRTIENIQAEGVWSRTAVNLLVGRSITTLR